MDEYLIDSGMLNDSNIETLVVGAKGERIVSKKTTSVEKAEAENQRLKEALNAINNLAVGWQEGDIPISTWDIVREIYNLSLLPEEAE